MGIVLVHIQNLWERYGLRGVAFAILALFVLLRLYQLLFHHRELKRERLRANYLGQAFLGLLLASAALILCEPRLAGLPEDIFGFGPVPDESGVANVQSLSRGPKKPIVNWGGPLKGVDKDIDKGDWSAAALKLFEPRRNGVKDALTVCNWDPYVAPLARAYASLGKTAADKGDKAVARQYLGVALELVPDADVYLLKAGLEEPDDWKIALEDLENASRRAKPGDYRAVEQRLALRLAHREQGETRGALADTDVLLAARPSDVDLLIQRGRLRLALGAVDGAIADLTSATRARPNDVQGRLALAEARIKKALEPQFKLALTDLEAVIRDMKDTGPPQDVFKAHLLRAQARLGLHKAPEALPDASKAVQLDPKSAEAYFIRGRIEMDLDRSIAAKTDLEQAIKLDSKHRNAILWHGVLIHDEDPRRALADFVRAIELEPDPWAHYYRGLCLLRLNRPDDAEAAFNEVAISTSDPGLLKLAREGLLRAQGLRKH